MNHTTIKEKVLNPIILVIFIGILLGVGAIIFNTLQTDQESTDTIGENIITSYNWSTTNQNIDLASLFSFVILIPKNKLFKKARKSNIKEKVKEKKDSFVERLEE